ncbi:MAG: helix-turn-helix domain-containing protein [Calditrichaeota bacterium]|nr:helix-turn-helix domain-containing protein [Calditrichota bacterium]
MKEESLHPQQIARRIEQILNALGWTQEELAAALGVTQPAVSQYLKGRIPPAPILYQLARLGQTTMEWILTGHGASEPGPAVHEDRPGYGREAALLALYRQLPPSLQTALTNFLRQLVRSMQERSQ